MLLVSERFTKKVRFGDEWDCWEWIACRDEYGYGRYSIGNNKVLRAHKAVFQWWHQREVLPELEVMHLCHNPCCVNPCHLKEGTHQENMAHSRTDGRTHEVWNNAEAQRRAVESLPRGDEHWTRKHNDRVPRGEGNGNSKLTPVQVNEMRLLRKEGMPITRLARIFAVRTATVSYICLGRMWAHLSPEEGGT